MAYQQTKSVLAQMRVGQHGRKDYNYLEEQLADAYSKEAGITFLSAWQMRDQIATLVGESAINTSASN
jgi:hypothetical protein